MREIARAVRVLLAVLGSAAVEGPVTEWVATHRKHHQCSDKPGDSHSPHLDDAPGRRGALRGLAHAHVGWMFRGKDLGFALTGSVAGGLTGLLWGGPVRVLVLHHATFSINSLCHFFGRRPFATGDESRDLVWLAPITLGEAWHNNHHAFPTSARHGLERRQLDPGAWLIGALVRCGLAWDVVEPSPGRLQAKRCADDAACR